MKWNPDDHISPETKAAIERFEQLGRDLNADHPRKHIDQLVEDSPPLPNGER